PARRPRRASRGRGAQGRRRAAHLRPLRPQEGRLRLRPVPGRGAARLRRRRRPVRRRRGRVQGGGAPMRPGDAVAGVGETVRLPAQAAGALPRRPLELRAILRQIQLQGNQSLPLLAIMAAFVGLVVAYQTGLGLQRFGAKQYIGYLTVLALVREMIPVLTALVIGGRIAAGPAAEPGGMVVTEQVAPVRALGADPGKKLVMPRIIATMLALPALAVLGDVIAGATGLVVAQVQLHVTSATYLGEVKARVIVPAFLPALTQPPAFRATTP